MRILLGLLIAATLMTQGQQLAADEGGAHTTGELRGFCSEANKPPGQSRDFLAMGYCYGLISGFVLGFRSGTLSTVTQMKERDVKYKPDGRVDFEVWCAPRDIDNRQYTAVFMQWADRNPARWHEQYPFGIISAFVEAWRCKR